MDDYQASRFAEGKLDSAIAEAIGGAGWWEEGGPGLPFDDWNYDWYDSSVELLNCQRGFEPSPEALGKLQEAGVWSVFVSYAGAQPDSYGTDEEPAAIQWYFRPEEGWRRGRCSARVAEERNTGLVRELKQRVAELERQLDDEVHRRLYGVPAEE